VRFTREVFNPGNAALVDVLDRTAHGPCRAIVVIDSGVAHAWPDLSARIAEFTAAHGDRLRLAAEPVIVPGGEVAKNGWDVFDRVVEAIDLAGICRRSFVIAIGGGAVLDAAGFAAATAHRGVRLIRIPTTTLAQADSGIGVKNAVNARGKKNFLGVFAPPWAVINDEAFLATLTGRHYRGGFAEAVKVALVKDRAFFELIERNVDAIRRRDETAAIPIIRRSAEIHLHHITDGGDPFELTAARPLDFGHWAAHRLEAMSDYALSHGDAVAIGMALDIQYSVLSGRLETAQADRTLACLARLGFNLWDATLERSDDLLCGLEEFREHLGGQLTIPLLAAIGEQVEVHEIDHDTMRRAIVRLAALPSTSSAA